MNLIEKIKGLSQLNKSMATKVQVQAPQPVPLTNEQILANAEQLPDGRITVNKMEWLQAWTQVIQKDVASGKLSCTKFKSMMLTLAKCLTLGSLSKLSNIGY